jgi:hypothetical protein
MKIVSKEFILGSAIYIFLYVAIAHIIDFGLFPEKLKPLQHGLGQDFFLVLAPLIVITAIMAFGASIFILHQFFTVIGMLVLDTLGHFKRK